MPDKLTPSEQSRLNGSKSKGPKTPEGRAKSSTNAIKHGFAATSNVVLLIEDEPAFEKHLAETRACYQPRNYAEQTLVDQLASLQWRQSRLVAIETALIDAQVGLQNQNFTSLYPNSADDEYLHLVKAWQALAHPPQKPDASYDPEPHDPTVPPTAYDITSIELVRRYQVSLDRQFRNALLNLRQYRKDFAPQQPATPNEPETPPPPPPTEAPSPEPQPQSKTKPPASVQTVNKPVINAPIRLITPIDKC